MSSRLRKLILLILGIPFVILGSRFLLDIGETLITHQAAASWTPQQATLIAIEYFSNQDQALGDQIIAKYEYEVDQKSFQGQFSCIGKECPESNLQHKLTATQNENQPVTILVNPNKPEQSLLYRHLHMPLILLKTGVGLFCFLTGTAAVIFGVYLLYGPGASKRTRP